MGSLPVAAPLLRYQLPASFAAPPLLAAMHAAVLPLKGGAVAVLLKLQFAVPNDIGRNYRGG